MKGVADLPIMEALALDEPASKVAPTSFHDGTDYTLTTEHSFCWITVDSLSVKIQRFDGGVGVEVYRSNEDIVLDKPTRRIEVRTK